MTHELLKPKTGRTLIYNQVIVTFTQHCRSEAQGAR
jgi:hypothetical protein